MKILEIACFNYDSCLIAQNAGANRIEFCENYEVGGLTPKIKEIEKIKNEILIPVNVMIRPRGGDFFYTNDEIMQMKKEIEICKKNKIDGVVFGLLNNNYSVDYENVKELVEIAKPMQIVFHRAFDLLQNPFHELEKLIALGVDKILTSGLNINAEKGIEMINKLIQSTDGLIEIIVGGGIRSENLKKIASGSIAKEFHSSALLINKNKPDCEEIKKMLNILKS